MGGRRGKVVRSLIPSNISPGDRSVLAWRRVIMMAMVGPLDRNLLIWLRVRLRQRFLAMVLVTTVGCGMGETRRHLPKTNERESTAQLVMIE